MIQVPIFGYSHSIRPRKNIGIHMYRTETIRIAILDAMFDGYRTK
jgi:hypothetical protein